MFGAQNTNKAASKMVPLSWQQRGFIPKHKMWCGWRMDELWSMPSLSHPTVAHTKATPRKLMKKREAASLVHFLSEIQLSGDTDSRQGDTDSSTAWCHTVGSVMITMCDWPFSATKLSSNQLIKYFDVGNLKIKCPTISKHTHSTLNYPSRLLFENTSTLQYLSGATFFDKLCKVVLSSYVWLVSPHVFSTN